MAAAASRNGRSKRVTTALGWTGLMMVVLGLATSSAGRLWPPRRLPEQVKSPILAIELLRSEAQLPEVVHDRDDVAVTLMGLSQKDDRTRLKGAVKWDFAFIAAYVVFLTLFGLSSGRATWRALAVVVIAGGITGAFFDVVENIRILALLDGASTALPRGASLLKWRALFVVTAAIATLTVDRKSPALRRWLGYSSTIVGLIAAVGGGLGLAYGNDRMIETAGQRLATAWFLAYLFSATRYSLANGLQAALDGLAARPWLKRIATWPDTDRDETVGDPIVDRSTTP
jgi:hypothetical protein